jgi:hypothetical protein
MPPKLAINEPGDSYEQEADRVAEQVMRTPELRLPRACPCGGGCPQCRAEQPGREHASLQTKRVQASDTRQDAAPAIVHDVIASKGQPLDPATRGFVEPRFGHDFSRVRVHCGAAAEQSARAVSAAAYTVGHHVVFGHRQYAPQTAVGQRLLTHELAHVVQQGAARPQPGVRDLQERSPGEAPVHLSAGAAGIRIQREVVDPREFVVQTIADPRKFEVSEGLEEPVAGGGTSRREIYWTKFDVDDKGVIRASVRTVSPDRAYRSGRLRFGESFRNALQHFEKNGVAVTAFEGDWSYMTPDEISENLKVFREEMAKGGTREDAARKTSTGRVAARSGFVLTNVENVPETDPDLAAQGVRRWRVKATFVREAPVSDPGSTGGNLTGQRPSPVTLPEGDALGGLEGEQLGPMGRTRVTPVEEPEEGEGGAGAGATLAGVAASIIAEAIGPMLYALALNLIPRSRGSNGKRIRKGFKRRFLTASIRKIIYA